MLGANDTASAGPVISLVIPGVPEPVLIAALSAFLARELSGDSVLDGRDVHERVAPIHQRMLGLADHHAAASGANRREPLAGTEGRVSAYRLVGSVLRGRQIVTYDLART